MPTPTHTHTHTPTLATQPPRLDLYCHIHKGLRLFMSDTLTRVGRMDLHDAAERESVLGQVLALLDACRAHVARENTFIHPAMEARRPGASSGIGAEHDEHLDAIATLESEVRALTALPQPAGALRLYRRLSRFVAENFEHMLIEETHHNATLWEAYTDAELIGGMPPPARAGMLQMLAPHLDAKAATRLAAIA